MPDALAQKLSILKYFDILAKYLTPLSQREPDTLSETLLLLRLSPLYLKLTTTYISKHFDMLNYQNRNNANKISDTS